MFNLFAARSLCVFFENLTGTRDAFHTCPRDLVRKTADLRSRVRDLGWDSTALFSPIYLDL